MNMIQHIHESNLIEVFDDTRFDKIALKEWNFLLDHLNYDLDKKMICDIQAELTLFQSEIPDYEKGEYRLTHVFVGGQLCPNPRFIYELMYNWIKDMNEHWRTLEPEEMHIRFEKIHPFVDGNGRVGRLLMWWHEMKIGREPTLILNSNKQEYYKWFR